MMNPDCLPCWQALLAFAREYGTTVIVYQDGVGVVEFPAKNSGPSIHLHSLGGVHFNLMIMENEYTGLSVNNLQSTKTNNTLYFLENDECSPPERFQCKHENVTNTDMCAEATKEVCTIDDSPNVILTLEEIQQLQASDLSLSRLINLVKLRKPEDWSKSNLGTLGSYARLLARQDKLQVLNDVLFYQQTSVIPSSNIEGLVQRFPVASGHMGRDKILATRQQYYYSLELAKVVSVVIQKCIICQTYKGNSRGGEPQLRWMAHKVYEQYAIDLLELEPARGNVRYLLVGVDVLSRFVNAIPIKDKCAGTVVIALE